MSVKNIGDMLETCFSDYLSVCLFLIDTPAWHRSIGATSSSSTGKHMKRLADSVLQQQSHFEKNIMSSVNKMVETTNVMMDDTVDVV